MPQIILTNEECENIFHNALCNVMGSNYMEGYGLQWEYNPSSYKRAKEVLTNPSYEDVLLQILKNGGELTLKDFEGDGAHTKTITIKDVYEKLPKTPFKSLSDIINGYDDVETGDVIIQTIFYNEIIFG